MRNAGLFTILTVALFILLCQGGKAHSESMGTAFTYQGKLIDDNDVADGLYDFQFKLYDTSSDGNQINSDVNVPDLDVIDGYFTVELDFGSVFDGNKRWLEIGVRPGDLNDPNVYTTLEPRQKVTPTPYSIYAKSAGSDNDWMLSGNDMYSIPAGNVGIGTASPMAKLDVSGGVKLGDVTTCGVSNEGTLRYNSGEVQYCDGTSWKPLGPTTPIIWSGGCSSHGRAAGWNIYCNNCVDFNTAAAYISADGNGTFTFLKSGYYRINFWCISNMLGYTNIQFVKNGSYFIYTMNYLNNQWIDNIADQIWPFNAGDSLQIEVYNSGGNNYAYHSWSSSGAHSRVQISYEGPLD